MLSSKINKKAKSIIYSCINFYNIHNKIKLKFQEKITKKETTIFTYNRQNFMYNFSF